MSMLFEQSRRHGQRRCGGSQGLSGARCFVDSNLDPALIAVLKDMEIAEHLTTDHNLAPCLLFRENAVIGSHACGLPVHRSFAGQDDAVQRM
jgi:hypothetical protein